MSPSSFIVSDRVLGNEAFSAQNLAIDRIVQISNGTTPLGFALTVLFVLVFLAVLVRVGLVAAAAFFFILLTLGTSPPLILDQWYAGRAMIALLVPLTLPLKETKSSDCSRVTGKPKVSQGKSCRQTAHNAAERGTVFPKPGRCVCPRSQISRQTCPECRPGQGIRPRHSQSE